MIDVLLVWLFIACVGVGFIRAGRCKLLRNAV